MLPSLHTLSVNGNTPGKRAASDKEYEGGSSDVPPGDEPESPGRLYRPRRPFQLERDAESAIVARALEFANSAMPAPFSEEAFGTVYCIAVHRVLEGFGIMTTLEADEFDAAANTFLEYLTVKDVLGPDPGQPMDVSASPFDDFSRFKAAEKQTFPEEGDVSLLVGHVKSLFEFRSYVSEFKMEDTGSFMKKYWKMLAYSAAMMFGYAQDPELWTKLNGDFAKMTNPTFVASLASKASTITSTVSAAMSADGQGVLTGLADLYLPTVFSRENILQQIAEADVAKAQKDKGFVENAGFIWETFWNYVEDKPPPITEQDKADNWTRSIWQFDTATFGAGNLPRLAFYLGCIGRAISNRYAEYRLESMKVYIDVNSNKSQMATRKELRKLARDKYVTKDDPVCAKLQKALVQWRTNQIMAKKYCKPTFSTPGWLSKYTTAEKVSKSILSVISWKAGETLALTSLPYGDLVFALVKYGRVQNWRRNTRRYFNEMSKAFAELRLIKTDLTTRIAGPRVRKTRLCGHGDSLSFKVDGDDDDTRGNDVDDDDDGDDPDYEEGGDEDEDDEDYEYREDDDEEEEEEEEEEQEDEEGEEEEEEQEEAPEEDEEAPAP